MSETPQEVLEQWLETGYMESLPHIREAIRAVMAKEAQSAEHIQALLDRAQRSEAERDALCQKAEAALRGCRSQSLGLERDRDWLLRSLDQYKNGSGNPCAGILASRAALRDTVLEEEEKP
jgi:hypothetical protein